MKYSYSNFIVILKINVCQKIIVIIVHNYQWEKKITSTIKKIIVINLII